MGTSSSYGGQAGSYMMSGMKDIFKSKDANDTMNGGLSNVHKYMSPFWEEHDLHHGRSQASGTTVASESTKMTLLEKSVFFANSSFDTGCTRKCVDLPLSRHAFNLMTASSGGSSLWYFDHMGQAKDWKTQRNYSSETLKKKTYRYILKFADILDPLLQLWI